MNGDWRALNQRFMTRGGLAGTDRAAATAAIVLVRLLKIGAAVVRNTRRIRILFASHHPLRNIFLTATRALASP